MIEREIRRVPPTWEHPKVAKPGAKGGEAHRPLRDASYAAVRTAWVEGLMAWELSEHPDQQDAAAKGYSVPAEYWDEHGAPPARADYRPDWPASEATAWVVYDAEAGVPLTPVFTDPDRLVAHLVTEGDTPASRWLPAAAQRFVRSGRVPAGVLFQHPAPAAPPEPAQAPAQAAARGTGTGARK